MVFFNVLSYILVLLGAVNWGLFGIFDFNLVSAIFMGPRSVGSIIVYCLIAAAAIWLIISPFITNGMLKLQQSAGHALPSPASQLSEHFLTGSVSSASARAHSFLFSKSPPAKKSGTSARPLRPSLWARNSPVRSR